MKQYKKYNRKLQRILPLMVLMGLLLGMISPVQGKNRQYITTGREAIVKADMASAKQKAVDKAIETAVQSAAVSLVPSEILHRKLDAFYGTILGKKEKFLVSYKVLGETAWDEMFLVGVKSLVNLDLLRQELITAGVLEHSINQPRVLLLMAEQGPDDILPKYWWGKYPGAYESIAHAGLKQQLETGQLHVLPEHGKFSVPGDSGIEFSSIYDGKTAMDLARTMGASLVILGRARAVESSNRSEDKVLFEANIEAAVYDPARGEKIFADSFHAAADRKFGEKKGETAILNASRQAGDKILDVCRDFFARDLNRETHFLLTIHGDKFLPRFLMFKQKIMDMPGIVRVQPMEMGVSTATMDMIYQGSIQKFADQIMLTTFPDFGVEIAHVMEDGMNVHFVEK